jgi:RHS repeat-associated protein
VKTYNDLAGRPYKTVYPDGAVATLFYNTKGQMVRQVDPDGVTTLFAYNCLGERTVTAVDVNRDGIINYNGTDRVARTTRSCLGAHGTAVQRVITEVWDTDNVDTPRTASMVDTSASGLQTWQTVDGLTTHTQTVLNGGGARTATTTAPDGTVTEQTFLNDRLLTTLTQHPSLGTLASASREYDPHGRLHAATDARTGTTTYTYYDDDQIHTITTPDPDPNRSGDGYDPQVTTYTYDSAGRVQTVTQPDNGVVNTTYYPTGSVLRTWGSRIYPQEFTYDPQGRVKTLRTWQDFAGNSGAGVTTWNYDPVRGWLKSKRYADASGPDFTYWPSGRLKTRTWARTPVVTTTYTYNAAGDLWTTSYSDATLAVTLTYDRRGRLFTTADAAGTLTRTYHASGQLQNETYGATSLLANLALSRSFDWLGRIKSVSVPSVVSVANSYDSASRLKTVASGANSATYGYLANSPLVETITLKNGSTTRLTTTKVYDNLNRLASISSVPSAASALSNVYTYNSANQRTRATREDASYWNFTYDALGQVTAGTKKLSTRETVLGNDYAYAFDDIGNRKTTTTNGRTSAYTPTLLNQYVQRTVPGAVDVFGTAKADATVTVNFPAGTTTVLPTTRQGEQFYRQLTVDNSTFSQYPSLTVTGVKNLVGPNGEDAVAAQTRRTFVPQTPEIFSYDADGNLTQDGRWIYTWDAENRLVAMETRADVVAQASGLPRQKLDFTYDAQGRRVQKKVSTWSGGQWSVVSDLRFIYDGWNLLAELNGLSGNAVARRFVWGLDLSGSAQGAGGVGGLLAATAASVTYAAAYDGNGNILNLVSLADGSNAADFEYDPFGNVIKATGPAATVCRFGFSTKYTDPETGLCYYGLRYYAPSTGRWLNRDPSEEDGGTNLYQFVGNNAISQVDALGLWAVEQHYDIIHRWLAGRSGQLPQGSTYTNYWWHCYTINVEQALRDGNDETDGTGAYTGNFWSAQAPENAYQHAMRAPKQTVAAAAGLMRSFIDREEQEAQSDSRLAREVISMGNPSAPGGDDYIVGIMTEAIRHIGHAQHPIADSTSPAHAGFQVWHDPTTLTGAVRAGVHHEGETPDAYSKLGGGPAATVAQAMNSILDQVLAP